MFTQRQKVQTGAVNDNGISEQFIDIAEGMLCAWPVFVFTVGVSNGICVCFFVACELFLRGCGVWMGKGG